MNKLVIKNHNFENAKKEIKTFSEQQVKDLKLDRVDEDKGFGEFFGDILLGRGIGLDHVVKGEQLNELTSQIQKHLCNINDTQIKLIKEFGQVYNALEALDKDYIQGILISIKATETTSEGIKNHQIQINELVENQRKTLEVLMKFKQKLDGYIHLSDIDKIWSDCQKWKQEIELLSKHIAVAMEHSEENSKNVVALRAALKSLDKKTNDLSERISQITKKLDFIGELTSTLGKFDHLNDIDEMWNLTERQKMCLKEVDLLNKEQDNRLNVLEHEKENLFILFQKNKEEAERKFEISRKETADIIENLTKKIKIAYWIAGGSAGLAIIELLMLLR